MIADKVVIDFGGGIGKQSVAMALNGARKVIGIDIQRWLLERATERAEKNGVADLYVFTDQADEQTDVIVTRDTFEHFHDATAVLQQIQTLIKPGGFVPAAFGPT